MASKIKHNSKKRDNNTKFPIDKILLWQIIVYLIKADLVTFSLI